MHIVKQYLLIGCIFFHIFPSFLCEHLQNPTLKFFSSSDLHHFGQTLDNNTFLFTNESVVVVSSNSTTLYLICNATYPITWKIHNRAKYSAHGAWMINIRTRRIATDILNIKTYSYAAVLTIYGQHRRLTGTYTCQNVNRYDLRRSIYIYFQDTSQDAFIESSETIEVEYKDGRAVLPCVSSNPRFKPALLKMNNDSTHDLIRFNKSVSFDPKIGITFQNLLDPAGTYKCVNMDRESSDFVIVNVFVNNGTTSPEIFYKSNATFTYNYNTTVATCCSNSSRAPVVTHYFCNHPAVCEYIMDSESSNGFYHTILGRKSKKGGCAKVKLYVHSNGIIKCKGDGVNIQKHFISGIRSFHEWRGLEKDKKLTEVPVYFNWWEIDPHSMIVINLQNNYNFGSLPQAEERIYEGQALYIHCTISSFYFSEGIRWILLYKNETTLIINNGASDIEGYYNHIEYGSPTLPITADVNLKSIRCSAPVWNSTEYITKSMDLFINASLAPVMSNKSVEEFVSWNLNDTDKEIQCEAMGIPLPELLWSKQDDFSWHQNIMNINHTLQRNNETNVTLGILKIHRVNYGTNGTYICVATNYGGQAVKSIHVFVLETSSTKLTVVILVGIIFCSVLISGIFFMIWKLRKVKLSVENLSSAVSYKDGSVRQHSCVTDVNNSSIDPSKFSENLINDN